MNQNAVKNTAEFSLDIKVPDYVRFVLSRLNKSGFMAFVAGGAVRDAVLLREAVDWDITTNASVSEIKSVFKDTRHFSLKHETVTLVNSGVPYEITTMKGNDGENSDILIDLSHRDFTLNAMAYDADRSVIIDPFNGACDIRQKTVRAVIDPAERFKEDPLRMLRAVRIAGELDFVIHEDTIGAIPALSSLLSDVSVERIRDEFIKIINCEKPSFLLEILFNAGLMDYIVPEIRDGYGMEQNSYHMFSVYDHTLKTVENVPSDYILRIAALFHDIGKPRVREMIDGEYHFYGHEKVSSDMAGEILARLRFSREDIKKITDLILHHMIDYTEKWSDAAVRRLIRRSGWENIDNLLVLKKADIIAHGIADNRLELLDHLESRIEIMRSENASVDISDLAIDGKRIMEITGISPGPEVGKTLKKLLEMVLDDPGLNTEDRLTEIVKVSCRTPE